MARFDRDGAELDLTKSEYIFVYLSLSYVLHGAHLEDHDFANILGMAREDAEMLMTRLGAAEDEARARGEHWNPSMSPADPEV
jgi:hypothetical protein